MAWRLTIWVAGVAAFMFSSDVCAQPTPSGTLSVTVSDPATGDGRSVVKVVVGGGPAPGPGELASSPALPRLECADASTLAASGTSGPAVVAPAVRESATISCSASLRGTSKDFSVRVKRPPAGLYAIVPASVSALDKSVSIEIFAIDRSGRTRVPSGLRVATSSGKVRVESGARITLTLPESNAPRTIAIALVSDVGTGAVFVPVAGVTTVPVKTRARASVVLRVSGREFGPFPAPKGRADARIVVAAGVKTAVVRATSRNGFANEKLIDLRIPAIPSVAAVSESPSVVVRTRTKIVVAAATSRGAPEKTLSAKTTRGTIHGTRRLGAGLFAIDYTPPTSAGTVSLDVIAGRTKVSVPVEVKAGTVRSLRLTPPKGALIAGARFRAAVQLLDAQGNPVTAIRPAARIASTQLQVSAEGSAFVVVGTIPQRLPKNGVLLTITAGNVEKTIKLAARSGPIASVNIDSSRLERAAEVTITARDRHGNVADPRPLAIEVTGGTASERRMIDGVLRTTIIASETARMATLLVRTPSNRVHKQQIHFGPPAGSFVLGARVHGGASNNLGELTSPRLGLDLGVRRSLGPIEAALLVGVQGGRATGTSRVTFNMSEEATDYTVSWIGFPVLVRGRLPVSRKLGVSAAVGGTVMRTLVAVDGDFASEDEYSETVFGFTGALGADRLWGPGRAFMTAGYTSGRLDTGALRGRLAGLEFFLGYEWWLLEL